MREITGHRPGKIFLVVIMLSLFFTVFILPFIFEPNAVFFGWMTVPLFCGAVLMFLWLVSIVVYVSFYWPYR